MKNKGGFTLIEILLVISIIAILAIAILVSVEHSRRNARINSAKTALQTALPAIITCRDNGGSINSPAGGTDICATAGAGINNAKWPVLQNNYAYLAGVGSIDVASSSTCYFKVSTSNDNASNSLTCNCATQTCQ